ncbi:RPII140-upstream gene protein [Papilio machaon]|uniref:RPII140-upstream gene protein n=1 Tax=Papilio machaon TaxID=76193 RepID=UPI001E665066|nr:RPII140-upstream gene protein [Papilio machaon]
MIRTAIRLTPTIAFPFFEKRNVNDYNKLHEPEPQTANSGLDRVKKMFQRDEFEEVSVELHNVIQATLSGAFIGACFGGFLKSREAYVKFIERNQATAFTSTIQAKKQLQDYVTIRFAKGAVHWGWRLGLFTGCFSLITTVIAVYRGESSLIDYVMAGALTGGIYKANLGVAGTIVGATVGGVLSAFGGLLILNILKITGVSMEDVRRVLYNIKLAREDQYNQVLEKSAKEKHDNLTRHHDKLISEKGEKKIEEIS